MLKEPLRKSRPPSSQKIQSSLSVRTISAWQILARRGSHGHELLLTQMTSSGSPGYPQQASLPPHCGQAHMLQPTDASKLSQFPWTQTSSLPQSSPHPPQCSGWVSVSTQAFPHWSRPPQSATQVPPEQSGVPPLQTSGGLPHAIGLDSGSMQLPLELRTKPGRHSHVEFTQYSAFEHCTEQLPH